MLHHIPDNGIQFLRFITGKIGCRSDSPMLCKYSSARLPASPPTDSSRDPSHPPDKSQFIGLDQETVTRLQPVFLVMKPEMSLAAQDIVDQVMWLGGRPEAVQRCRLGASATVHIQTSCFIIDKIQFKCFSMIGPFPFRVTALSSNSRESHRFHQIPHRNPCCIHSYAAKFSSYPHLLPE